MNFGKLRVILFIFLIALHSPARECSQLFGQIVRQKEEVLLNYRFIDNNAKQTIVFIHGNGTSLESFSATLPHFPKGFNFLSYDQRGHGLSHYQGLNFKLDTMVQDLRGLVEQLGLKQIHLVGHSFGGRIAIAYAAKYSNQTLSVTIEDMDLTARQPLHDVQIESYGQRFLSLNKNYPSKEAAIQAISNLYGSNPQIINDVLSQSQIRWGINNSVTLLSTPFHPYIWGSYANAVDLSSALKTYSGLVLFLKADPQMSAMMPVGLQQIQSIRPNAPIISFKGSSHAIHQSVPKPYAEAVGQFIKQHSTTTKSTIPDSSSTDYWENAYKNFITANQGKNFELPYTESNVIQMVRMANEMIGWAKNNRDQERLKNYQRVLNQLENLKISNFPEVLIATHEFLKQYTDYSSHFLPEKMKQHPYLSGLNLENSVQNGASISRILQFYPRYLPILATKDLTYFDFLKTAHLPIFFLGASLNPVSFADGRPYNPIGFLEHDIGHMRVIIQTLKAKYDPADPTLIASRLEWYPQLLRSIEAIEDKSLQDSIVRHVFYLYHEFYYPIEFMLKPKFFEQPSFDMSTLYREEIATGTLTSDQAKTLKKKTLDWINLYFAKNPKAQEKVQRTIDSRGDPLQ